MRVIPSRATWAICVIACVLAGASAGTAAADDRPRIAKGYRWGRPLPLRVVQVDGLDVEVWTARAFRAMQRAAAADGVSIRLVSGFRTHERQGELYRAWRSGWGNPAARPGYSNHQAGRALDLDLDGGAYAWLQAKARRHGFRRTVRGEPWHWEYFAPPPRRYARPAPPRRR